MTNTIRPTKLEFAVSGIATLLLLAALGCGAGEVDNGGGTVENKLTVNCPASLAGWAVGTSYKVGSLVSFKGAVFSCRQAHTAVQGWFPDIVPALWLPAQCSGGATPAPAPAPAPAPPPATQPPAPPTNGGCVGGPAFDPAGAKNVGNGQGLQFIGGQCLRTADCASGCCAFPCGICSGPGAQFQAGKQGCGFGG